MMTLGFHYSSNTDLNVCSARFVMRLFDCAPTLSHALSVFSPLNLSAPGTKIQLAHIEKGVMSNLAVLVWIRIWSRLALSGQFTTSCMSTGPQDETSVNGVSSYNQLHRTPQPLPRLIGYADT